MNAKRPRTGLTADEIISLLKKNEFVRLGVKEDNVAFDLVWDHRFKKFIIILNHNEGGLYGKKVKNVISIWEIYFRNLPVKKPTSNQKWTAKRLSHFQT